MNSKILNICRLAMGCLWCFIAILFIEDVYSAIYNPENYPFGIEMYYHYSSQSIYITWGILIIIWAIIGMIVCFWKKRTLLLNAVSVIHFSIYLIYLLFIIHKM